MSEMHRQVKRHFIIAYQTLLLCGIEQSCTYSVIKDSIIVVQKNMHCYTPWVVSDPVQFLQKKK